MANQFIGTLPAERNPVAEALTAVQPAVGQYSEYLATTPEREKKEIEALLGFAQQAVGTDAYRRIEEGLKDSPDMMRKLQEYAPGSITKGAEGLRLNLAPPNQGRPVRETGGTETFRDEYGNERTVIKSPEEISGDPQNWELTYNSQTNQTIRTNVVSGEQIVHDIEDDLVLGYKTLMLDGEWYSVPLTRDGYDMDNAVLADTVETVQTGIQKLDITTRTKLAEKQITLDEEKLQEAKDARLVQDDIQLAQVKELQKQNMFERDLSREQFELAKKESEFTQDLKWEEFSELQRWHDEQIKMQEAQVELSRDQFEEAQNQNDVLANIEWTKLEQLERQNVFDRTMSEQQFNELIRMNKYKRDMSETEFNAKQEQDEFLRDMTYKEFQEQQLMNTFTRDLKWEEYDALKDWRDRQYDLSSRELGLREEELDLNKEQVSHQYKIDYEQLDNERARLRNETRQLNLTEDRLRAEANQYQNIAIEWDNDGNVVGGSAQYVEDGEIKTKEFDGRELPLEALPAVAQYQEIIRGEETVADQFRDKSYGYVSTAVEAAVIGGEKASTTDAALLSPGKWRSAINTYSYAYGEANGINPEVVKANVVQSLYEDGHMVADSKGEYMVQPAELLGKGSEALAIYSELRNKSDYTPMDYSQESTMLAGDYSEPSAQLAALFSSLGDSEGAMDIVRREWSPEAEAEPEVPMSARPILPAILNAMGNLPPEATDPKTFWSNSLVSAILDPESFGSRPLVPMVVDALKALVGGGTQ